MLRMSEDSLLNERRLVTRVLHHWHETAMGQRFPHAGQIDPWLVGDDWSSCALIRLAAEIEESRFVVVGADLLPQRQLVLDGEAVAACPAGSVLGVMMKYLPRFQPNGGPLRVSGAAQHFGNPVLFRAVLLPLSDDEVHIDHVLAAANFRPLHRGEEKELRTRLEVAILKVEKGQIWEVFNPLWGGWGRATVTAVDDARKEASLRHQTTRQSVSAALGDMTEHTERYRFLSYS
jgi:hypothetical protein